MSILSIYAKSQVKNAVEDLKTNSANNTQIRDKRFSTEAQRVIRNNEVLRKE